MTDVEFRVLVHAMRTLQRVYNANPSAHWGPSKIQDIRDLEARVDRELDEVGPRSRLFARYPDRVFDDRTDAGAET